ncbi:MAG: sulfurtransferase TusA family protein [Hyphomicrobiaceae bacterium]
MQVLDTKGMNCPIPILKARKTLDTMSAGEALEIHATDPGAVKDFEAFCRQTGHELVESSKDGEVYKFIIQHKK